MSNGRKFLPKVDSELSPEDRLATIEQMVPVLIERIQSYDKVVDDLKGVLRDQESFITQLRNQKDSHDFLVGSFDSLLSDHKNSIRQFSERIINHDSILNSLKSSHDQLKDDTDNAHIGLVMKLEEMSEIHNDLASKVCLDDSLDKLQDAFNLNMKSIEVYCYKNDQKHKENESYIKELKEYKDLSSKNTPDLINSLADIKSKVSEVQKQNGELKVDVYKKLENTLTSSNDLLSKKCNELKGQVDSLPDIANTIKSDLMKKLDVVQVDVSTSNLKCNNITKQIIILEKKIENIYAQLKNNELERA